MAILQYLFLDCDKELNNENEFKTVLLNEENISKVI